VGDRTVGDRRPSEDDRRSTLVSEQEKFLGGFDELLEPVTIIAMDSVQVNKVWV
jgi:hypothetical protein